MKTFLFVFIFALSLNADSLVQSKCVKDYYIMHSTSKIYFIFSNTPTTVNGFTYTPAIIDELVNNIRNLNMTL